MTSTSPADELVERLKERAASYRLSGPSAEHTAAILDAAADLLERQGTALRDALVEIGELKLVIETQDRQLGAALANTETTR